MPSPSWRVGAFAERYPQEARDIGRACAMEAAANRMLYAGAGVVRQGAIMDAMYGCQPCTPGAAPAGCCGSVMCTGGVTDSCCQRGTCAHCGPGEYDFDAIYTEQAHDLHEHHAYAAAVRDVLTDPDVEDVGSALDEVSKLHGKLAPFYAPAVPAKKLPDGSDAPARCPICGCTICSACGCSCECCSSAHEKPSPMEE